MISALSKPESKSTGAFTLIELLVVMAIIGILMGLLFPALSAARHRARVTRTRMEMKQIETAWISYRNDYRHFPPPTLFGAARGAAGEMNQNAVDILKGQEVTSGSDRFNTRQISYMEFPQDLTQFNDPWEAVYRFSLSTWSPQNLNEVMFSRPWAPGPEVLPRPVAVYSTGSNGEMDPIKSW